MQNEKTNPAQSAAALERYWSQEILAQANGQLFKAAKGVGSTEWHAHDDQDEVFYVLKGQLVIQMRDRDVTLDAGELFVVPRGVEHCPKAEEDVHLLVIGATVTSTKDGGKPDWS